MKTKNTPFIISVFPIILLLILLYFNTIVFGNLSQNGSMQFIMISTSILAGYIGVNYGVPYQKIIDCIGLQIKASTPSLLTMVLVGGLSSMWLLSGITPTIMYYAIEFINPNLFYLHVVLICAIVSTITGSSWLTSGTVGIALLSVGNLMDFETSIIVGAIISGAYFGDKISPISDTTLLSSIITKVSIVKHVRYMMITSIPSLIITCLLFLFLGLSERNINQGSVEILELQHAIKEYFYISPYLLIVPIIFFSLIRLKIPAPVTVFIGITLGASCIIFFQENLILEISKNIDLNASVYYGVIMNTIVSRTSFNCSDPAINYLFQSGAVGIQGMLHILWIGLSGVIFGGTLQAIGTIDKINNILYKLNMSILGLFSSTVGCALTLNFVGSSQNTSIILTGYIYNDLFKRKKLAKENLSRIIEDTATTTNIFFPHSSCANIHYELFGVTPFEYGIYAIFNWISPIITLAVAALHYKIRKL